MVEKLRFLCRQEVNDQKFSAKSKKQVPLGPNAVTHSVLVANNIDQTNQKGRNDSPLASYNREVRNER